ncbi:hypothetical protein CMI46_01475 [Candidatus Pacearchaeota archaeon]|nr:hypothetical protein [Candidatus Pacearchaeota archaeon]|tara:strand:- start:21176 stop:22045 length:870 start_codon:yes stop_codon:yes gene_type:complete
MVLKKPLTFEFLPEDMEMSLDNKIKKIDSLIIESLKLSRNPLLLFSGGSDSLLLLAFLLKHKPDIKVFYIDMRMNFPSYEKLFNEKIKPLIKNLHHCKIDYNEEDFVKKFGIPIYPGVEEMGYDNKEFETIGINNACSKLKKVIMDRGLGEIKPDLTFMGFLASDKPKRYNRALNLGYLQLGNGENLCIPLAMLKKDEVFAILDKINFPYVKDTYFNKKDGHLHKGDGVCWMCSAKCFNNCDLGNWQLLKDNYPELWERIKEYGLKEKIEDLYEKTGDEKFKEALGKYF